jgi:hypothetical protein
VDLRWLRLVRLREGTTLHVAYQRSRWPELFNRFERGNARFSPPLVGGAVVPTMYAAATQTVALLETAFHDVHGSVPRIISEPLQLATRGLVALTVPASLRLIDLTDDALGRLGLTRGELVATTPEHYECTREWAARLHAARVGGVVPVGLMWRSRVAELAGADSPLLADLLPGASDVCVLFGDRVPIDPAAWRPGEPRYPDLSAGAGRLLAEQIAELLGAVIVPR